MVLTYKRVLLPPLQGAGRGGDGFHSSWRWLLATAVLFALAGQAAAQSLTTQPNYLRQYTLPPPMGTIEIGVQDQRAAVPDKDAETTAFTLRELTVEGAVTLAPARFAALWADKIGATISLAELYRVADGIKKEYARDGYFVVTVVPVQDWASGKVVIRVYESYISQVKVSSSINGIEKRLAPYIGRITAMRPVRQKEAERLLLLMDDLGGLEIGATLLLEQPSVPSGAVVLDLKVDYAARSIAATFDNDGYSEIGPLRLTGVANFNDVFGIFDSMSFTALTIPNAPQELLLTRFSHDLPIGRNGLHAGYSFTRIGSKPDYGRQAPKVGVVTMASTAYLRYPFLRTIAHSVSGGIEFNFRNDDIDVDHLAAARDKARWLAATLQYEGVWGDVNAIAVATLGQGINGLGANASRQETLVSRPGVPGDYRYGRLDLDIRSPLFAGVSLRVQGAAQTTRDALPVATQFSVGGEPYGWVYNGMGLAGDKGAGGMVELSRPVELGLPMLSNTSARVFADYGAVWNNRPLPGFKHDKLGSWGLGFGGVIANRVSAQLSVARPWHKSSQLRDLGTRVFFSLGVAL